MDYVKANYERLLLLLSGLLLLGVSFHAVSSFSELQSEYQAPQFIARGSPFAPDDTLARLQKSEAGKIADPSKYLWKEHDRSLFVSRVYLLREGELVDISDSGEQLHDGIDNAWILLHGLEGYTDPDFANKDPDNDGFTNLEEFREGTKPKDASSLPPLWKKLRVKSFEKIPFRLKFMGSPSLRPGQPYERDTEFSINTLDHTSPTQFLKVGDKIAGTELEIVKAESKLAANQMGGTVDVSELTLKDHSTGDTVMLVNEKEVDSPYSFAVLKNTVTGEEIRVEKGKTFPLGPDPISYKLIDVGNDGALISPSDSGKEQFIVPPLEEKEEPASETLP